MPILTATPGNTTPEHLAAMADSYGKDASAALMSLAGRKVALLVKLADQGLDPDVMDAVEAALSALTQDAYQWGSHTARGADYAASARNMTALAGAR